MVRVGVYAHVAHPFMIDANRFGLQVNTTLTYLNIGQSLAEPLIGVEGQTAMVAALQVRLQRSSW